MTDPTTIETDVYPTVPAPRYKLYADKAVRIASILGSPLAGSIVMALNYKRLGKPLAAVLSVVLTLLGTAIIVGLASMLPNLPGGLNIGISIGLAMVMGQIALSLQGPAIIAHQATGGKIGSGWTGAFIGTGFLILIVACLFIPELLGPKSVPVGSFGEIQYSGSATENEANALGSALQEEGMMKGPGKQTVEVEKGSGGSVLSFCVADGIWNDPAAGGGFLIIARKVSKAFGGFPAKVQLIDTHRSVKKEWNIPAGAEITGTRLAIGKNDEIYYSGKATEAEAKSLAALLVKEKFFVDDGKEMQLSKGPNGTTVSLTVGDAALSDPKLKSTFENFGIAIAPAIGGLPITVKLLNYAGESKLTAVAK